jgi:hypothetical protein
VTDARRSRNFSRKCWRSRPAQQAHDCNEFVPRVAEHIGTQDRRAFLREAGAEEPDGALFR